MRGFLDRLRRDQEGVSAIEFAMIAPMLVLLAVGTFEFGRLILLSQKLQNGSFILADLAARDRTLSVAQLDNIFLALDHVIQPFGFIDEGTAIVSSVSAEADGDMVMNWQRRGAGDLDSASTVGVEGGAAQMPAGLNVDPGDTVIVAEVFYDYQPIFGLTAEPRILHKISYFKPRLGTLDTLLP